MSQYENQTETGFKGRDARCGFTIHEPGYTAAVAQTRLCMVLSYLNYMRVYYFLPRTAGKTGSVRLGRREGRWREN